MSAESGVSAEGCFCGLQDLIHRQTGVMSTCAGYTGGDDDHRTHRNYPDTPKTLRISMTAPGPSTGRRGSSSFQCTTTQRKSVTVSTVESGTHRRSRTGTTTTGRSPSTPSPTLMQPSCGRAVSLLERHRRPTSGKRMTRTISGMTRMDMLGNAFGRNVDVVRTASFTAARQRRRGPMAMGSQDPLMTELPSLAADCTRANRRVWKQALGNFLPVTTFGIASAICRTRGATKIHTPQMGGRR